MTNTNTLALELANAYDMVDRFLRENLDDSDYADYSGALEMIRTGHSPAPAASESPPVAAPAGMQPVARIRYERNTPGRENEMPRVVSCNRMADGVYEVFTAAQVQAMLAAVPRNATLYNPDDVAFPVQRCADGTDAPTELASIAKQASTAATAATSVPIKAGEYPELPEWSKRDDLGGLVPGEVRQALRTYADATCAARVVYSRSMDLVRTFWQQHTESDALSMTMAELHDDVELVIRAARKPIEDGVLHALYADVMTGHYADGLHYWRGTPAHRFARAIEQAHGITAAQKGGQHGAE